MTATKSVTAPGWVISIVGVAVVASILYFARDVLIPIALAVLLTFLFAPLVRKLERVHVPRVVSACLIIAFVTLVVGAIGWVMKAQAVELATHLPHYKTNILQKLESVRMSRGSVLSKAGTTIAELGREIADPVDELAKGAVSDAVAKASPTPVQIVDDPTPPLAYVRAALAPIVRPLATTLVVIVFFAFMLMRWEDLRNRFVRLIGEHDLNQTTQALIEAGSRVSRFLLALSLINCITGVAIGLGLYVLNVPNAALWGLLTALLRFIPYVGIWAAAAFPLLVSFAVSPGWSQPLSVLGLILVVEVVGANVLEPIFYRVGTGISPIAVLSSAVFWAWLWGPAGLLLATPLTVCLAVLGRHVPNLGFLSVLLSDEPVLSPETHFYQRLLAGDRQEAREIVNTFAKERPAPEVFDALVLPSLRLSEIDRHRGAMTDEQTDAVHAALAVIVEEAAQISLPEGARASSQCPDVLCIPARDAADELAAGMLARVLIGEGVAAAFASVEALTGEIVNELEARPVDVVCISAVPPNAALHVRVLCKRIRARVPDCRIVVGIWDPAVDTHEVRRELADCGVDDVFTSLSAAAQKLRSLASVPAPAPPPKLPAHSPASRMA